MPLDAFVSGPLVIDTVAVPGGGEIGLTHFPGRQGRDGAGRVWQRSLAADLDAIAAWGPALMVSLVEVPEFARLGVPDLPAEVERRALPWRHFPIADMTPPSREQAAALDALLDEIGGHVTAGRRVLFHCAAGLGRTGTLAALVLVRSLGLTPEEAIAQVRRARPGTIETAAQAAFVHAAAGRPPASL